MKHCCAAICLIATAWPAAAQNVRAEPEEDPVQAAIREFNRRDRSQPNEVTVVLDSPADTPPKAPVLVTGTPPENAELVSIQDAATAPSTAGDAGSTASPAPGGEQSGVPDPGEPREPEGLTVRVEKLQTGAGAIDPKQVKLAAPFPAKPISRPPAGWKLLDSEHVPTLTREVELTPGSTITLTVRPHVLVPEDDGQSVFTVAEPGFDTALGYAQNATVGAILTNSLLHMDEDSKRLGTVVDQLQQLLVSLPKPASPEATTNPTQRKP